MMLMHTLRKAKKPTKKVNWTGMRLV